jgi:hypothetical protein
MGKDNIAYKGIPILGQLLNFFDRSLFDQCVYNENSDEAHGTVSTWDQFVFMSYAILTGGGSLRETYKNLQLLGDKIVHLGVSVIPARSSISDANRDRQASIFGQFYLELYSHFKHKLSDSYLSELVNGEVKPGDVHIFDSTTISLFRDVYKNTGQVPANGRAKGGIKSFTKIILGERVPNFICLKAAATNEKLFLMTLQLATGTIAVFDKGFQKFKQYAEWTSRGIFYVTLMNKNAKVKILKLLPLDEISEDGVVQDAIIELSYYSNSDKMTKTVEARMVAYIDPVSQSKLVFVTNLFSVKALTVSLLYKNRWVIEPLFKQIKQNFELTYFLTDSEQGIKTQIWIALIWNLIFTVIHKEIKEAEDFSTMVKVATKNLYSYVNFILFMKNPGILKKGNRQILEIIQLEIFTKGKGG